MNKIHVPEYGRPIEHAIVRALLKHLRSHGFKAHSVAHDETVSTRTDIAALDEVFSVDECTLRFVKQRDGRMHGVLLVIGTSMHLISDWTYDDGDPDGFHAAMRSFHDLYLSQPIFTLHPKQ